MHLCAVENPQMPYGKVAQLVRACGSYPQCRGFKSLPCYQKNTSGSGLSRAAFFVMGLQPVSTVARNEEHPLREGLSHPPDIRRDLAGRAHRMPPPSYIVPLWPGSDRKQGRAARTQVRHIDTMPGTGRARPKETAICRSLLRGSGAIFVQLPQKRGIP